jgi:DNA-directed RNA polymerase subunit RPC12/RpoP/regulation of enolase protein 1 (concanavalin A-like superfamily)
MSEFKYACPVCGQHIKCDSSQAGSVMDCPTCFQKITVPQAPASDDQKFILTGSKVTEKKTSLLAGGRGVAAPERKFPAAVVLILLLVAGAGGAGIYFFGPKVFPANAWQTGDTGSVGVDGAFGFSKGVFTVSGSGADIWNRADSFRYVFQALNGDGTLTARVLNLKKTDVWAKAGVMLRESLDPGSPYVMALVTAASGIAFQQRDRAGNQASSILIVPQLAAPCWLRLVRQGHTFTAYSSADGATWTALGSTTIPVSGRLFAGLAVSSHNNGTLCQAQFDNVTLRAELKAGPAEPAAPKLIAPHASGTNWLLTLGTNAIPDAPVAGRIHGQDFIVERATFQNGSLMLRAGTRGAVEFGAFFNFSGTQPEALSGKNLNILADTNKSARVSVRWKDAAGTVQTENYDDRYALRLEFGELVNNRLPGKIYLCLPDAEKSYLLGSFNADARKPKPKAPKK